MPNPVESTLTVPVPVSDAELRDLLKDATVSPDAIREEIETGGSAPPEPAVLKAARRWMAELGSGTAPDDDPARVTEFVSLTGQATDGVRRILMESLREARWLAAVTELAAHADKALSKEGKRLLHLWRSQGIAVDVRKKRPAAPVAASFDPTELPAFMSAPNATGVQTVVLARQAPGSIDVTYLMLSLDEGVRMVSHVSTMRREYRRFVQEVQNAGALPLAEIPLRYACQLVSRALETNDRARTPVPPQFNEIAFLVSAPSEPVPSPGQSIAPAAEADSAYPWGVAGLGGWTWDAATQQAAAQLAAQLQAMEHGPDAAQVPELAARAIDDFAAAYWTLERRQRLAGRLYDTAFVLLHRSDVAAQITREANLVASGAPARDSLVARGLVETLVTGARLASPPSPGHLSAA